MTPDGVELDVDLTSSIVDNQVHCSVTILATQWVMTTESREGQPWVIWTSEIIPINSAQVVWGPLDGAEESGRTVALVCESEDVVFGDFSVAPPVGEEFPLCVVVGLEVDGVLTEVRQALKESIRV